MKQRRKQCRPWEACEMLDHEVFKPDFFCREPGVALIRTWVGWQPVCPRHLAQWRARYPDAEIVELGGR